MEREDLIADAPGRKCVVCGGNHWYYRHLGAAVIHDMYGPQDDSEVPGA